MSSYASVQQIKDRLPQVKLSATSRPTDSEVDAFINQVEAELNVVLKTLGFVTPVTQPLSILVLRDMVVNEVASKVIASQFAGVRNPDDTGAAQFHAAYVEKLRALINPDHPFTLPDADFTDKGDKVVAEIMSIFTGTDSAVDDDRTVTRDQVF